MARFCEECGTPLEPNENFCSNCGAKVIRDEPPQPTYTPPVNQPSTQQNYTPPKSTPAESTSPSAKNHMGKFLALIGILVLIGVITYFANNRQSDEALGEFYLGMSKDEADRKFGKSCEKDRNGNYYYANENFLVTLDSNNKVNMIFGKNETVNTKKGIHVGSTLDEVKRAYGNDYQFNDTTFKENPAYIYTIGNSKLFFFMDKATNRVSAIRVDPLRR